MFKLRFSPPEYKIYQDGKTTLCFFNCRVYDTARKSEPSIPKTTFRVYGKAVCSDSDTIDEKIGRMLSESRAKRNAYDYVIRKLNFSGFNENDSMNVVKDLMSLIEFYRKTRGLRKVEAKHTRRIIKMTDENNN